jgi:hypothetical protein
MHVIHKRAQNKNKRKNVSIQHLSLGYDGMLAKKKDNYVNDG